MPNSVQLFEGLSPSLLSLILMIPFFLIALILLPFFLWHGYRHGTRLSLISLLSTLAGGSLAVLLSRAIGLLFSGLLYAPALQIFSNLLDTDTDSVIRVAGSAIYLGSFARSVVSYVISFVSFGLLCILFLVLAKVISFHVAKNKLQKEILQTSHRVGGLLVRLFDAVLVAFLLCAPVYTLMGDVAAVVHDSPTLLKGARDQQLVLDSCATVLHCPTVAAARIPVLRFGRSSFASFSVDGERFNSYEILHDVAGISDSVADLISGLSGQSEGTLSLNFQAILVRAGDNRFLCGAASDVLSLLRDEGKTILPIDSANYPMLQPLLEADAGQLTDSIQTLGKIFSTPAAQEVLHRLDAMPEESSAADLIAAVNDPVFLTEAITAFRSDPLLSQAADSTTLLILESVEASMERSEGNEPLHEAILSLRDHIESGVDADPAREAVSLIYLADTAERMTRAGESDTMEADPTVLAHMILGIASHPYFEEPSVLMLADVALSFIMPDDTSTEQFKQAFAEILAADLRALPAVGEESRLENLFLSLQDMTNILENVSEQGSEAYANTEKAVEQLLLTSRSQDSAAALSALVDSMVPDELSDSPLTEGASVDFMCELFESMTSESGSEAALAEEAPAITMILRTLANADLLASTGRSFSDALQGINGCTVESFVENVAGSDTVMRCVSLALEKHDVPDPLGIFKDLNSNKIAEISKVCDRLSSSADADTVARIALLSRFLGA